MDNQIPPGPPISQSYQRPRPPDRPFTSDAPPAPAPGARWASAEQRQQPSQPAHDRRAWGQPPSQPPSPPNPWHTARTIALVLLAIVVVAALLAMATRNVRGSAEQRGTGPGRAHEIRYTVVSDAPYTAAEPFADMTFKDATGSTAQQNGRRLPWTYTFTATPGAFLYVSAQNHGSGEITCTVLVDGQTVKSSTSSGEFAICQVSGKL